MVSKSVLLGVLPAYHGNYKLIVKDQQVPDIIREVVQSHKLFAHDYDRICDYFDAGNLASTAKRLFDFCRRNIAYRIEPENKQTTKNPAAILAMGYGDCKHYALFISGVLDALRRKGRRISWWYRFASYNPLKTVPGHVFVVIRINGSEVWVDPVLPTFNNRKRFFYNQDKHVPMALYRVSGPDDTTVGRFRIRLPKVKVRLPKIDVAKGLNRAANAVKKIDVAKGVNTAVKVVKKIAASPARNAFLALVGLNVHGFATSLKRADQNKLKDIWEKLGGNYTKLKNTIDKGANKKRIAGTDDYVTMEGVGVIQAGAALAAAAPIIAALAQFLKAGGNDKTADVVDTTVATLTETVQQTGTPVNISAKTKARIDKTAKLINTGTSVVQKVKRKKTKPTVRDIPLTDPTPVPAATDPIRDSGDTAQDIQTRVRDIYQDPTPAPAAPSAANKPDDKKPNYLMWGAIAVGGYIALKATKVIK